MTKPASSVNDRIGQRVAGRFCHLSLTTRISICRHIYLSSSITSNKPIPILVTHIIPFLKRRARAITISSSPRHYHGLCAPLNFTPNLDGVILFGTSRSCQPMIFFGVEMNLLHHIGRRRWLPPASRARCAAAAAAHQDIKTVRDTWADLRIYTPQSAKTVRFT